MECAATSARAKSKSRSSVAILAAIIFSCSGGAALAALNAADVPTFQLRARVTSCEGKEPEGKKFTVSLADVRASVTGNAWTDWLAFGPKQIQETLKVYSNAARNSYPVVADLTIGGVVDPTVVEIETRLKENAPVSAYTSDLFGPRIGLLIWRDGNKQPHIGSMQEYNQRYWEVLKTVSMPEADRPKLFPLVDRFIGSTDDRKEWMDGLTNLGRAGFSVLFVPPDPHYREMLLKVGLHRTAWGVYNPPGYAFEFTPETPGSTTPEAIAKWANEQIAPFLKAGFKPEDMAMFAMSDEPGWYFPTMLKKLQESPEAMQHFRDYLKGQGLTSQDLGATSWEQVQPLGRSKATDLPSRRLFYWVTRFLAWDSARHFANCVRALEKASCPNMPIFTNWNFFNGRLYFPGPFGNNPDKTSPDSAMGGQDWLEAGRMRSGTLLFTEDWFSDAQAYQWSFYSAKLRCAAEKGGVQFGGYIIPRTAGDRKDGILQKILTLIGSGGKGVEYFVFGPEYAFPGNCYSENVKVIPKMAEAHQMIGKAEELLWPGARPRTQVAILAPRSAELWDEKNVPLPTAIVDCTNPNLNAATVDYMAEVFDLYVALEHADIPADFVEEDDLSLKGLAPYKVLYVTEPNIPAEFQKGLLEWTQKGGTVVTVTGAGAADRYDDPCDILAKGLGVAEQPRERELVGSPAALKEAGKGSGALGHFTAFGPRGKLTAVPKDGILASFADGSPAIIEREVGSGRVVHFTWMPGLSYLKSSTTTKDKLPVGFSAAIRSMITYPVQAAKVAPPVTVDQAMIETPLLLSAKGGAVTLLNWTGGTLEQVTIVVQVPFAVKSVESVKQGNLTFSQTEKGVTCALPLGAADIVLLRP